MWDVVLFVVEEFMKWILLVLLLVYSCRMGLDIDERRRGDRIRESMRMMREVERVREKCSPRNGRPGRVHRKRYYS